MLRARYGQGDRVLDVVQIQARCAGRDRVLSVIQIAARCAGVIVCRCGRRMRVVRERGMPEAEHGVAVDRFAREIVAFLKSSPDALAATERQAVSRLIHRSNLFLA